MKKVIAAGLSTAMLLSSTSGAFAQDRAQAMKDARDREICKKYAEEKDKLYLNLVSAEYKIHEGVNTLFVECADDEGVIAGGSGGGALAGLGAGGAVAVGAGVLLLAAVLGDDDETVTTTTTTTTAGGS